MQQDRTPQTKNTLWTGIGLLIALLGLPVIVTGYRFWIEGPQTDLLVIERELTILALCGLLLWIIKAGEGLPLRSINLHFDSIKTSLLRSLLLLVFCAGGLALGFGVITLFDLPFGSGSSGFTPAVPALLLTFLRAGLVEEIFYRGYAIERLQTLTGNKFIAIGLPLLVFAGFHFRQGTGGIVIVFIGGAILTAFYLWKKDLLANIIAHFLVDFIPNILLPLISGE